VARSRVLGVSIIVGLVLFSLVAWGDVEKKGNLSPPPVVIRNPFQPPSVVTKRLLQSKKRQVPLSPLQKYDVESFVLKGVVADMAMVVSPDGGTYIIKRGTKIGKYGEEVVGVYKDKVAIKRGDKVIYLAFPKD